MRKNRTTALQLLVALPLLECLAFILPSATSLAAVPGAKFQGLGFLDPRDFESEAHDVSADGRIVAGHTLGFRGVYWNEQSDIAYVGNLPNGGIGASAWAISGDGSVIVGQASSDGGFEAYRRVNGVMTGLGDLPGGPFTSNAYDVSADGNVVVGWGISGESPSSALAFRWTPTTGMQSIGDLPGGRVHSEARAISGDGSTITGLAVGSAVEPVAFRWTQASGMRPLHDPTFASRSTGFDASFDGSVIVGEFGVGAAFQLPFRWTSESGMTPLSLPAGKTYGAAVVVSDDASLIGGWSAVGVAMGRDAVLWDAQARPRFFQEILTQDYGLNLNGWRLQAIAGISANGRVFVGSGTGPDGRTQAWRAVLPIPEPKTGALVLFAMITCAVTRSQISRSAHARLG
jgi:probable HAF family extracellular repeat protein